MRVTEFITEKWTKKYKSSINCSHPKGFSQKAHCAGKKKHNESMMTMETVCPDCGMCQTHGSLNEIAKGAKDSNGVTKCWPGKHAEGTKKGRNGGQVRNCVPNEGVAEEVTDLGKEYGAPAAGKKPMPHGGSIPRRHNDDPDFMDPDQRRLRADQARVKKAQDEYHAKKKGMAEEGYGNHPSQRVDPRTGKRYVPPKSPLGQGVAEVAGAQKCWPGYRKTGTQPGTEKNAGKRVNDCEKIKEDDIDEAAKHGLYYNVNKRKKAGTSRDASSPKAPTAQAWRDAAKTAKTESLDELSRILDLSGLTLTADEQFDIIENMVESWALYHGVDSETIWEDFESVDDAELLDESAAWHRSAGKSAKGGLNRKGVASYRAEHPGSHLQMAVTTKPSKLKPGSKAAKRRKSFCARMGGNKGPMKKPNGDPTRKALALRKWHCE